MLSYEIYNYYSFVNDKLEEMNKVFNILFDWKEKYNDKNENLGEKIIKITGYKNCNEETCTTYEDYAKFINFLADNKE